MLYGTVVGRRWAAVNAGRHQANACCIIFESCRGTARDSVCHIHEEPLCPWQVLSKLSEFCTPPCVLKSFLNWPVQKQPVSRNLRWSEWRTVAHPENLTTAQPWMNQSWQHEHICGSTIAKFWFLPTVGLTDTSLSRSQATNVAPTKSSTVTSLHEWGPRAPWSRPKPKERSYWRRGCGLHQFEANKPQEVNAFVCGFYAGTHDVLAIGGFCEMVSICCLNLDSEMLNSFMCRRA